MKPLHPVPIKRPSKRDKEKRILLALVEYYLKTGKAVGSNVLKEVGFPDLSSATIRNYFAALEEEGYLKQQHTSGGRIPTTLAFRLYIDHVLSELEHEVPHSFAVGDTAQDMKEVALFLQRVAEEASEQTGSAAFLSAPRFDRDFVTDIKFIKLDYSRALSIVFTSFGQVYTEILHAPRKIEDQELLAIEAYAHSRLLGKEFEEEGFDENVRELAVRFYQESMTRYLVSYSNFSQEDLFRTGFSKLLRYPEFQEAESLASCLLLFENQTALRGLIRECVKGGAIKYWMGEDLNNFLPVEANCTVIAAPYSINQKQVGAIGIIGPMRLPYKHILTLLNQLAGDVSKFLENSLYKHKISFRTAREARLEMEKSKVLLGPTIEG
ncbi:MAG: heat-inducible transcriptional repressor HrcA [Verrucomicrobia bacterium]|nr:heat-inducible transcriptional repressor HrcA [Verrucomicrobiota bacterium]